MLLTDKVVIVTGGANGLGRVYCTNLCHEGAYVVVADRDFEGAAALVTELAGIRPDCALAVSTDVTRQEDTVAMAAAAMERFGRIDVLVNNAGSYPHRNFEDITYEAWRNVITVNLDSVFLCCQAVLPHMKKAGSGKIINIATNLVWIGLPGMAHYIAAKSGVVGLTRTLAREIGKFGITVNALAPGAVIPDRPLDESAMRRVTEIVQHQCVSRPQSAEDLVGPLIFLASEDSNFMSGQILSVDGGLTTH